MKYDGYIRRQAKEVERLRHYEKKRIPEGFEYASLPGLSSEVIQKLEKVRPTSVGQASRIPGVTPAAAAILLVALERGKKDAEK